MANRRLEVLLMTMLALVASSTGAAAAEVGVALQIAGATAAAPEDRRDGARVLGYDAEGALVELRAGTNEILCLADEPGDDRFHVACYHRSLDAFMARGRELRAQGMSSIDALEVRHREADAGKIALPESPAALYVLGGPPEILDPETGDVEGGHWVWSIYTPYATEESTGLPTTPQAPGAPWIMRPGTASSHIMVVQPRGDQSSDK